MIASLVLALYLLGFLSISSASTFLYLTGALLIIGELGVASFGILALNGMISLYAAYAIQTGNTILFGVPVDWAFLFGIAFVELLALGLLVFLVLRYRKAKISTGVEGMIGQQAAVIEWDGAAGTVRIQGEIWKARAENPLPLSAGDAVQVTGIRDLTLLVRK